MSHCPIKNTHRSLLFERILFVSRFSPPICSAISSQKKRAISPIHGNIHTNIFIWGRNTSQRLEKPQPTERDGSDTDPDIGIHCHDIGRTKPTPGPFLGSQKITHSSLGTGKQNMMKETFLKNTYSERYKIHSVPFYRGFVKTSNLGLARPQKNKDN